MEHLQINNLRKTFLTRDDSDEFVALDGISLTLNAGERFGLVGQSGCGKTTLAKIVVGMAKPDHREMGGIGTYLYNFGSRWIEPAFEDYKTVKEFRGRVQMIYQEAPEALEKRYTAVQSVAEAYTIHWQQKTSRRDRRQLAQEILRAFGLTAEQFESYPHMLSGGECKRVLIARALAVFGYGLEETEHVQCLLVADEPISGLDAITRNEILAKLKEYTMQLGLTLLVISHNLKVVEFLCDSLAIMDAGKIVEKDTRERIFDGQPENHHECTQKLLEAELPVR
jgi:ABC-type glutathione transport system ATPase component